MAKFSDKDWAKVITICAISSAYAVQKLPSTIPWRMMSLRIGSIILIVSIFILWRKITLLSSK